MGEEEYRDVIQPTVVTAKLPDINTSKGKQIAKNMARRIAEGKMDIKSVPQSYQSYVQGELKGAIPTSEAISRAGKPVAIGLGATIAAPWLIGAGAPFIANTAAGTVSSGTQTAAKIAADLLGFEVVDRFPTLFGQKRFLAQAGDLAESGFRAVMPDGKVEDAIAPYIRAAGEIAGGLASGKAGDLLTKVPARVLGDIGKAYRMLRERPVRVAEAARKQVGEEVDQAMAAVRNANNEYYSAEQSLFDSKRGLDKITVDLDEVNRWLSEPHYSNLSPQSTGIGRSLLDYIEQVSQKSGYPFDRAKISTYYDLDFAVRDLTERGSIPVSEGRAIARLYDSISVPSWHATLRPPYKNLKGAPAAKSKEYFHFRDPVTGIESRGQADVIAKSSSEVTPYPVVDVSMSPVSWFKLDPKTGKVLPIKASIFPQLKVDFRGTQGVRFFTSDSGPEIRKGVKSYLDGLRQKVGNSGVIGGSGTLVEEGYIAGLPGDVDFITTKSRLAELKQKLEATRNAGLGNILGENVSSSLLLGGRADIALIDEVANGNAVGKEALEIYSLLDPKGFNKLMKASAKSGINLEQMEIPMKAEEMLQRLIEDPQLMRLKTVVDNFGSYKDKHFSRVANMLYTLPEQEFKNVLNLVTKRYMPEFKTVTELYPNLSFKNISANAEYLKKLGFADDIAQEMAANPELVQRIAEVQSLQKSVSTRAINRNYLKEGKTIDDAILANSATENSATAGSIGGGNTMSLSGIGGGANFGNTRGIIQSQQTFHPEKITTPDELQALYERQSGSEAWAMFHDFDQKWSDLKMGRGVTNEELSNYATSIAIDYDLPVMRTTPLVGMSVNEGYIGRYFKDPISYGIIETESFPFETGGATRFLEDRGVSINNSLARYSSLEGSEKIVPRIEQALGMKISQLPTQAQAEVTAFARDLRAINVQIQKFNTNGISSAQEFNQVFNKLVTKIKSTSAYKTDKNLASEIDLFMNNLKRCSENTFKETAIIEKWLSKGAEQLAEDGVYVEKVKIRQQLEKQIEDIQKIIKQRELAVSQAKESVSQADVSLQEGFNRHAKAIQAARQARTDREKLVFNIIIDVAFGYLVGLTLALLDNFSPPKEEPQVPDETRRTVAQKMKGGLMQHIVNNNWALRKYGDGGPAKKKVSTRRNRLGSKSFTASYSDLSAEGKRIINELCKELNIPADQVKESYNSGRLDKVIATRYQVANPEEARVRANDSPTKETSEEYEARMNKSVYHGANYVAPNMPYAIPYLVEKEIKVPGVGRVSTNALDSLAKYAAITDLPLSDALGLAAQETAFGALPLMNYTDDDSVDNRALGNSSYFRNYGEIPAENFVRDFRYNSKKPGDKPIDRSVPPLQHAFEYFKKGNYNRGDKNHTSDVKAKGREVMKTKAIQDWIANSEFAQKALRKTTKRLQGGLLKYVSGNI